MKGNLAQFEKAMTLIQSGMTKVEALKKVKISRKLVFSASSTPDCGALDLSTKPKPGLNRLADLFNPLANVAKQLIRL